MAPPERIPRGAAIEPREVFMQSRLVRLVVTTTVVLGAGVAVAGAPAVADGPGAPTAPTVPVAAPAATAKGSPGSAHGVTRRALGSHRPINAPGQRLVLERVTVAPGSRIPRHAHAGTVIVRAERGLARFVVVRGSATVTDRRGHTRSVSGPARFAVTRGMTVVEEPLGVYSAVNRAQRSFVASVVTLDAQVVPGPVAPAGVESPSITLVTQISSVASTLANADPSLRYGWNHLVGDATVGTETVHCDMLGNVAYVSGAGPFFGFVTYSWPDGSSIVTEMFGESTPQPDGGAVVRALLTIVGGTGRYRAATGFGWFEGIRDATVGAPVRSVFTLTPSPG